MAQHENRRFAAIMFTDMVGYSALAHKDEALAQELLEEHRSIVRPLIEKHNGKEVKTTGDGFLVEFSRPVEAVRCAIEMQGLLQTHNSIARHERQIHLRIGIHFGEIEEAEGDIYGDGVNIAARIESLAETDGICMSDTVYSLVRNKINMPMVTIGKPELKNIDAPIEIYKVRLPSLEEDISEEPETEAPVEGPGNSIAVLPFENMSPDPENEYFSDGMTEELIDALAHIEGLRVISRTSAFAFKGKELELKEIAERLGVDTILEGSVRKAGDRLRITAQLINVADDSHLWSERFDKEMGEIFDIQEEIAQSIVKQLKPTLLDSSDRPITRKPTDNLEAYDLYLQGAFHAKKRSKEGFEKAIEKYEQARKLDPDFALAYAKLAIAFGGLATQHPESHPRDEWFPKARAAAIKALEINKDSAEAHIALGALSYRYDQDWDKAEQAYKRAIELQPQDFWVHHEYARFLRDMGRYEEDILEVRKALELDPLSIASQRDLGWAYTYARRYDEAIAQFKKTQEMDSTFPGVHALLGYVYLMQSKFDLALYEFENESHQMIRLAGLAMTHRHMGNKEEADQAFEELLAMGSTAVYQASVYAQWGEVDQTFQSFEKYGVPFDIKADPLLDPIRKDPRYFELLKKMKLVD